MLQDKDDTQTKYLWRCECWLMMYFWIIDKLPHGNDPPRPPTPKWWTKYYVNTAMQMTHNSTFHHMSTLAVQLLEEHPSLDVTTLPAVKQRQYRTSSVGRNGSEEGGSVHIWIPTHTD